MYRNKGTDPSRGRFDIGIPIPEELDLPEPHPLVTFECGRNKKAVKLLRDLDAAADHAGPEPADITKLAREISCRGLPYGYALEFYDKNQGEAEDLLRRLWQRISNAESDRLHVVVLVCIGGSRPMLTFLPAAWEENIRLEFRAELERIDGLTCARKGAGAPRIAGTGRSHCGRVRKEDFLRSSTDEACALIEALEPHFGRQVRLHFGPKSMTVNRRPSGLLLRIKRNSISDLNPAVSEELAAQLHQINRPTSYKIDGSQEFREAVITAVGRAFDK
jgi:hypothetical protein